MERVWRDLLTVIMLGCVLFPRLAVAEIFDNGYSGDYYHLYEDSIVTADALVEYDKLFIDNGLLLQNYGEISSSMVIENGTEFKFQNSGIFSGEITFGDNSWLVQVIRNLDDINNLNLSNSGSWSVLVQDGGQILSFSDIQSFASGADKIVLDGATLTLGSVEPVVFARALTSPTPIEIKGEVWIDLGDTQISDGMTLISGITGDGSVNILSPDVGRLYYLHTHQAGDNLILDVSRETDYEKIIGDRNARGAFINKIRMGGANQSLLGALDSQMTMDGLSNVINNSAVLNPIKLMNPVSAFFRQSVLPDPENVLPDTNVSAAPVYIFGNGMNLLAGQINLGFPVMGLRIGARIDAGNFSVSDNLDDFDGNFIGGALTASWNTESLWMHSTVGYSESMFNTGDIFAGSATPVTDPTGKMLYFAGDAGMNFYKGDFYFSPFAGIGANHKKILFQSENNFYAEMGGRAGIKTEVMGVRYDYGIFASAGTDSFYSVGAKFGTWSVMDAAGVDVEAAIMNYDFGAAYKISANIRFNF